MKHDDKLALLRYVMALCHWRKEETHAILSCFKSIVLICGEVC